MWVEFSAPQVSLSAGFDSVEASVPQVTTAGTLEPRDYVLENVPQVSVVGTDFVSGPVVAVEESLPNIDVQATATQQPFASVEASLPQISIETSTNETDLTAPHVVLAAEILNGNVLDATLTAPQVVVGSSATAIGTASAAFDVPQISIQADAVAGRVLSADVAVPNVAVSAEMVAGGAFSAAFSVPNVEILADLSGPQAISVAVSPPQVLIVADMVAPVAASDKLLAMNTNLAAVTEFAGWAFNSFASFGGKVFAAGASGIFELDASDTDASALIAAELVTGDLDFGDSRLKNVNRVYVEGVFGGDMELDTVLQDGTVRTYLAQGDNSTRVSTRTIRTGDRPLSSRWRFAWRNRSGADFRVVRFTLRPSVKERRVINGDR